MNRPEEKSGEPRDVHLVQVILATFEMLGHRIELAWVRRDEGPRFRVADRATGSIAWFPTYELAREVFAKCCEEAGQPSFRSPRPRPSVMGTVSASEVEEAAIEERSRRQGGVS